MTITSNGNNSWTLTYTNSSTGDEMSFTLNLSSTSAATLETEGTYDGTEFSIGESNAAKETSDNNTPDDNNNQQENQQETISITALNGNWSSSGELTGTVTMDGTVMTDRDLGFYISGAAEGKSTCTAAFGIGILYEGETYEVNDRGQEKSSECSITSTGTNSWRIIFDGDTIDINLTSATEGTCAIKGSHSSTHYGKNFVYDLSSTVKKESSSNNNNNNGTTQEPKYPMSTLVGTWTNTNSGSGNLSLKSLKLIIKSVTENSSQEHSGTCEVTCDIRSSTGGQDYNMNLVDTFEVSWVEADTWKVSFYEVDDRNNIHDYIFNLTLTSETTATCNCTLKGSGSGVIDTATLNNVGMAK